MKDGGLVVEFCLESSTRRRRAKKASYTHEGNTAVLLRRECVPWGRWENPDGAPFPSHHEAEGHAWEAGLASGSSPSSVPFWPKQAVFESNWTECPQTRELGESGQCSQPGLFPDRVKNNTAKGALAWPSTSKCAPTQGLCMCCSLLLSALPQVFTRLPFSVHQGLCTKATSSGHTSLTNPSKISISLCFISLPNFSLLLRHYIMHLYIHLLSFL